MLTCAAFLPLLPAVESLGPMEKWSIPVSTTELHGLKHHFPNPKSHQVQQVLSIKGTIHT